MRSAFSRAETGGIARIRSPSAAAGGDLPDLSCAHPDFHTCTQPGKALCSGLRGDNWYGAGRKEEPT